VVVKTLYVIHRIFQQGQPRFGQERQLLFNVAQLRNFSEPTIEGLPYLLPWPATNLF